jgi:RimJ/RimL family protein N-acetyltransferase
VRGLNRLQLETNADIPIIRAAQSVGFRQEGVLREAAWTPGSFVDLDRDGLLAAEWHDQQTPSIRNDL